MTDDRSSKRIHPEAICERCGGDNATWFAPSALWNAAHGAYDILCPVCFMQLAEAAGIHPTAWQVAPESNAPETAASLNLACDRFVRESASEFCAECGYTNVDHLRRRAEKASAPLMDECGVYHSSRCARWFPPVGAVVRPCNCSASQRTGSEQ